MKIPKPDRRQLTLYLQLSVIALAALAIFLTWTRENYVKNISSYTIGTITPALSVSPESTPAVIVNPSNVGAPQPTPKGSIGCTYEVIFADTVYQDDPYLPVGKSTTTKGVNGSKQTCTWPNGKAPTVSIIPPVSNVVRTGRVPVSTPFQTPSQADIAADRERRIAACIQRIQAISGDSSAYQQCYLIQ